MVISAWAQSLAVTEMLITRPLISSNTLHSLEKNLAFSMKVATPPVLTSGPFDMWIQCEFRSAWNVSLSSHKVPWTPCTQMTL